MNIKTQQIVNDKTGEVIYENNSVVPELFNAEGYYFWNKKAQSRQFTEIALPLQTYEDKGIFTDLCRLHLYDSSNFLEVKSGKTVRPFTVKDLSEMLDVSIRQAQRRLKVLLDSGVLAWLTIEIKGYKEEWLVVNPLYFVSGKRINDTLYKLFRNDLNKYLSKYAISEFEKRVSIMNNNNNGEFI